MSDGLRQGDTIAGKYVVDAVIGSGGMGFVVLATHPILGPCAIKLLHPDYAKSAEIVQRFVREAQAAQKIQNEHVVRVSDVGVDAERGVPYIIMERLKGNDLAHALKSRGPLPAEEAVEYVLQACEALAEAHLEGIVHRDLKPANLFVTTRRDGTPFVKVLDFGISKMAASGGEGLTRTSGIMGTVLYMSPEQLQRPKEVDARSDIWALGVILYELLSGQLPFIGEDMPNTIAKVMLEEPVPLGTLRPELPREILAVVDRCLRKNRDERYADVAGLVGALAEVAPARARVSIERVLGVSGASPRATPASAASPDAFRPTRAPANVPLAAAQTTTSGAVSVSPAPSTTSLPKASRAPLVVGAILLLVVVGVGAGFAMKSATTGTPAAASDPRVPPSTSMRVEPSVEPSKFALPAPEPSPTIATSASDSAHPAPTFDRKPKPRNGDTTPPPPTPPKPAMSTPPPTPPPEPTPTVNCNPPFYYDQEGLKHFKPECN